MASKVYFVDAERDERGAPPEKFRKLLQESGIADIIEPEDIVAIKMHFGEVGNTRYIRPIFARWVVDFVKRCGGRPFLTDTTTLYKHHRHTLFDYLEAAAMNGFTFEGMGCPIIIADGLKNTGTAVKVEGGFQFDEVRVAQAIYEADAMIVLSHPTLHPEFPIAGALKNVGMGCATRDMKMKMHSKGARPTFNPDKCVKCYICVKICPVGAWERADGGVRFVPERCVGCGDCVAYCKGGAIQVAWGAGLDKIQGGTLDAVRAVLSTFKPGKVAYINVAVDIPPACDCQPSGMPIVPDIGFLASMDPVAIDKATFDLIEQAAVYPASLAERKIAANPGEGADKVKPFWPDLDIGAWWDLVRRSGLGSLDYELVRL